jgi:V8-like Glu-specific endopeptidase
MFPHDCIGYLCFRDSFGRLGRGTAFLIASDLVLTVAHNIYSKDYGVQYKDFVFHPGVSGELSQANAFKVKGIRYPEEYQACRLEDSLRYDYALLKLDRKIIKEQYIELGLDYIQDQKKFGLYGYRDSCN